ncbi:MAG: molybdopterin-binding protein [Candidatus Bathyarchaeota archaeon]|nr:molybdopterin-binding protein [Candidatus Bathyarchaeota archaeon]
MPKQKWRVNMFRKLLSYQEAKDIVAQKIKVAPLGVEALSLLDATGRVLAADVVAQLDIPPFNRSTVDGYAVKAKETYGAEENEPVKLKVCGMIHIGAPPPVTVKNGEAAEIVTGAPIPKGADAVVMVEDTNKENDVVNIYRSTTPNENILKKGADIHKDELTLKTGTTLGSREIGVLAALGNAKAKVYKLPKVAVLSTGGEVVDPTTKKLPPGKIYDINAYSICTAVKEHGGLPLYWGVVPDEKPKLHAALKKALAAADVVVTSGGVSVGPKDIVPSTVDSLGEPGLLFSGIALKPGKPVTVGLAGEKPIFSFPGHPTSALLTFHLFAGPVIQMMAGKDPKERATIQATAGKRMFSAKGRRTFVMVRLTQTASGWQADPVETGASGAITTLAKADGYVEVPADQQFIDAQEKTTVSLFKTIQ